MKILFVLPKFNKGQGLIYDPNDSTPDYNYLIPIGMPYIAAYLKQNGYTDVHGINLNHHCGTVEQQVKEAVSKTHYDVIFTGGLSSAFREIKEMVRFIREVSPGTIVVVGGGLISSEPEVVMPLIKPDFGIIFEGEETALALLRWIESGDIAPEQIAGITFLRGGNVVLSPKREAIKDLDKLPYPDLDLFGYEEYISNQFTGGWNLYSRDHNPRPYVLVGSRGCIANCLSGDTLIATTNGNLPIQDLVGTLPKVLTRDPKTKDVCYAQTSRVEKTGESQDLVRVQFRDCRCINT
jgi:radical SAM superfamily enzyme YgiQ (UPF0313 family)